MKTQAALTAQAIRKELKVAFPKTKFEIRSSNFAGGNSVHIDWVDGPTQDQVTSITSKYEYGHFDGMTDCYEYSNGRTDIPQAKYVQVGRSFSEQTYQDNFDRIRKSYSGFGDATDMETYNPNWNATARQLIWRELHDVDLTPKEEVNA